MSRHGDVTFAWGDRAGEDGYVFRLGLGELRKLQERTNAGPYELLKRLTLGSWRVDDLRETIRLGLSGGGTLKKETGGTDDQLISRLIAEYVDERPLLDSVMVAARILQSALQGPEDDPLPKQVAAEEQPRSSLAESSLSPSSTDGVPSSAGRRKRSRVSRSGNSEPSKQDSKPRMKSRKNSTRQAPMSSTEC